MCFVFFRSGGAACFVFFRSGVFCVFQVVCFCLRDVLAGTFPPKTEVWGELEPVCSSQIPLR